ncbi:MAG: glycine--tRNA ligase subunit beta [Caulobacteraceae bacterium]|nr:glycine--tRNA ligase subunit beta [Caulobacter sp.]
MPQLLIELLSEEIPARMQAGAARDLARLYGERLAAAGLQPEGLRTYAGPRRLTLVAEGLPAATPDRTDEIKGPKASAPPQALEGFLRKTGLAREDLVERDGVLFATRATAGRPTPGIAAEALGEVMRAFPWPKSMRSGGRPFRWVRPLKGVLFLFDGAVVPFEIDGIAAGDQTRGHRFMGSRGAPFAVTGFDDYRAHLERDFVVLEAADRRARILEGARAVTAAEGLELVEDEGLLDEVAGLAEWPVPVLGAIDLAFLDLPPEVIRTSMRTHQKYFAVRAPGSAGLAPRFVVVANVEASDGGAALAAGNARVLSARLNDARFFWDEDRKPGAFDRWLEKLKGVTFHAKLGSMAERVERIAALAGEIAPLVGADPDLAERAARLAKADLASAMVGEFPELQGVMGGYYARLAGEPDAVADAVRDHYKPVGPSGAVPTAPVTVAVALADKLDTLVGFFAIDERPTGSKDPYALRRAALGVIRTILANGVRLSLNQATSDVLAKSWMQAWSRPIARLVGLEEQSEDGNLSKAEAEELASLSARDLQAEPEGRSPADDDLTISDIRTFFADRLKVLLRDEGRRHDLVDAVFALGDDDLVRITARVEALSDFLATEDGANLLASYTRASNILKAEEKKGAPTPAPGEQPSGRADAAPEEQALREALRTALSEVQPLLAAEDFAGAMASLAALRRPVDAFFDRVLVNDPDPEVRLDRLRLLNQVREAADGVADFSLIQG